MGKTPDQIETHIETKRGDLRSNLEELEDKVKSVTDWRQQFRSNPGLMLSLAFGGGMLLAGVLRRARPRAHLGVNAEPARARQAPRLDDRKAQIRHVWDEIQGALIGVATSRIANTLVDVVPGFRSHFGAGRPGMAARGGASNGHGVQGEGDYEAARRYEADVGHFVRSANIERAARAAAPQNEDEARELAEAEAAGRQRAKPS
jgi:hypothetical protein